MTEGLERYKDSVDYDKLDPVKQQAIARFAATLAHTERLRIKTMPAGETAAVFDFLDYDFMLGFNVEGLGTKNKIADALYNDLKRLEHPNPGVAYRFIGQDATNMSWLDLACVAADPFTYGAFFTAGASDWFADDARNAALLDGYRNAADANLSSIPCGETPVLPDIVYPETLVLEGASIGLIKPKERFPYFGRKIKVGDGIYGLPSETAASNGVSKIRKIAARLSEGYFTKLPSGRTLGDAVLVPTPNHARLIIEMFDEGIHYASPITGHAWKKVARARQPFRYVIDNLPEPPEVFKFLIEVGPSCNQDVSDKENYSVWNMGTMVTLIAPMSLENRMHEIAAHAGKKLQVLGHVEKGDREVYLTQKDITYKP